MGVHKKSVHSESPISKQRFLPSLIIDSGVLRHPREAKYLGIYAGVLSPHEHSHSVEPVPRYQTLRFRPSAEKGYLLELWAPWDKSWMCYYSTRLPSHRHALDFGTGPPIYPCFKRHKVKVQRHRGQNNCIKPLTMIKRMAQHEKYSTIACAPISFSETLSSRTTNAQIFWNGRVTRAPKSPIFWRQR